MSVDAHRGSRPNGKLSLYVHTRPPVPSATAMLAFPPAENDQLTSAGMTLKGFG